MPKIELTKTQLAALDLIIASLKEDGKPITVDTPMGFIGDIAHDAKHVMDKGAHDLKHAVDKGAHDVAGGVKDAYHAISGGIAEAVVKGGVHKKTGDIKPGEISLKHLIEIRKLFK